MHTVKLTTQFVPQDKWQLEISRSAEEIDKVGIWWLSRDNVSIFLHLSIYCGCYNWAMSWENLFLSYANNKGTDQPAPVWSAPLLFAA